MNDRLITRRDFARTSLAAAAVVPLTGAAAPGSVRSSRVVIVPRACWIPHRVIKPPAKNAIRPSYA